MADALLLKCLRSQPKVVNLSSKRLDKCPKIIGKLNAVRQVEIKNNRLKTLPPEFGALIQVSIYIMHDDDVDLLLHGHHATLYKIV